MVRGPRRRARLASARRRSMWEELARWWGCCPANRLADRAGRYRRIAVALVVLPVPFVVLAVAVLLDGGSPTGYAMAHLVVAVGSGWLASDLLQEASALNRHDRPHASAALLLAGIGLLIGLVPVGPAAGFGPPLLTVTGVAALVAGFALMAVAERRRDQVLLAIGRWSIVIGAVLFGAVELGQSVLQYPIAPVHAAGLGAVAVLLLAMAWSEARVLLRGAALLRALAQR